VLAILTAGGYVDSSAALEEGSPLGLVVDNTSFYAGAGRARGDAFATALPRACAGRTSPLLGRARAGPGCRKPAPGGLPSAGWASRCC
jgi:hypothetical protein